MKTTNGIGRIALVLFALLPLGCGSPEKKPDSQKSTETDSAGAVAAASVDRSTVIHVVCTVYRVNRAVEGASACKTIDFAVEDGDGVEIARKNPDANGTIDFPVPAGKSFKVVPRVPGAWTIEWIPTGDLKAGDSVKVILRR
ncbi:MAG: hypothetical protein JST04_15620 [Bdellovibrionales bacterium]|nr:hypothetical protein [Bdellovibrionales bacterium]